MKLAVTLEGGSRKQTCSTNKLVDELHRVRIVDRYIVPASVPACYRATRFFGNVRAFCQHMPLLLRRHNLSLLLGMGVSSYVVAGTG